MSLNNNIEDNKYPSLLAKMGLECRTQKTIKISNWISVCEKIYGEDKVAQLFQRYGWNLNTDKCSSEPLTKKKFKELLVGFHDITNDDMNDFFTKIRSSSALFTIRERDAQQTLDPTIKQELLTSNAQDVSQLPPHLFNALLKALKAPSNNYDDLAPNEIETSRISPCPKKYWEHGFKNFHVGRNAEDRERISLYEELSQLDSTKPQDESRYCEILSKLLVKKNMFLEKNSKLAGGILLPAMKGPNGEERWYRIDEIMDAGYGKFAYKLVPATSNYGEDMPDLILYRSTCSLPTAIDSFGTVFNDINPFGGPGYFSKGRKNDMEKRWYNHSTPLPEGQTGNRPLMVTGHSLGGAIAQVGMIDMKNYWPLRQFKAHFFDSPAISEKDSSEFCEWLKNNENNLQSTDFTYYISAGDIIPLGGHSYIGNGLNQEGKFKANVHCMDLTETGTENFEINVLGMPPVMWKKKGERRAPCGSHGRIWHRGKLDQDYKIETMPVQDYDKKVSKGRFILNKVIKFAMWFFLLPIGLPIFAAVLFKRVFIGRRGHEPLIKKAAQRAIQRIQKFFKAIAAKRQAAAAAA